MKVIRKNKRVALISRVKKNFKNKSNEQKNNN